MCMLSANISGVHALAKGIWIPVNIKAQTSFTLEFMLLIKT